MLQRTKEERQIEVLCKALFVEAEMRDGARCRQQVGREDR